MVLKESLKCCSSRNELEHWGLKRRIFHKVATVTETKASTSHDVVRNQRCAGYMHGSRHRRSFLLSDDQRAPLPHLRLTVRLKISAFSNER